jgi:hypothetical protein
MRLSNGEEMRTSEGARVSPAGGLNAAFFFSIANRIPPLNRFGHQQRFGRVLEALAAANAFFLLNSPSPVSPR